MERRNFLELSGLSCLGYGSLFSKKDENIVLENKEINTEKQIAQTIVDAMKEYEESYEQENWSYKKDMMNCLIEAGKKNKISSNLFALLDLAMYWGNDILLWAEDILEGRNIELEYPDIPEDCLEG